MVSDHFEISTYELVNWVTADWGVHSYDCESREGYVRIFVNDVRQPLDICGAGKDSATWKILPKARGVLGMMDVVILRKATTLDRASLKYSACEMIVRITKVNKDKKYLGGCTKAATFDLWGRGAIFYLVIRAINLQRECVLEELVTFEEA